MAHLFRRYAYKLSDLSDEDWTYINTYKCTFQKTDDYKLEQGLKFPGFIIDENADYDAFKKFSDKYFMAANVTSPRGNLGSKFRCDNNPVVVCGIAPGYSNLSRNEPKWLLGPSSKILHKMLYCLGIYPYFTNIYKTAFKENDTKNVGKKVLDTSLKLLSVELNLLLSTLWKSANVVYIITLGKYSEYAAISSFSDKLKVISTYHPSYYLRNGATSIDHELVKKGMAKIVDGLCLTS